MAYDKNELRSKLFALGDESYRDFHAQLIPDINKSLIIGIRTPVLRKFAKAFFKTPEAHAFMCDLPHKYYEENNLHAFLIEQITSPHSQAEKLDIFLPYVDNWATCDGMNPKSLGKNTEILMEKIKIWLGSDKVYTVRFGIVMLMKYFLDDLFKEEYLRFVSDIKSDEYYIKMAAAWYFATAAAKQYDSVLPYFEQKRLDKWTHNKAIQKSVESFRVTEEHKKVLMGMKY